jgi:hypothetical protein
MGRLQSLGQVRPPRASATAANYRLTCCKIRRRPTQR